MTCVTAHQLIHEALDVPGAGDVALESHVASCAACRAYQEGLKRVVRGLSEGADTQAPALLMDRLGLAAPRGGGTGPDRSRRRWMPLGVAAAAMLISLGVGRMHTPSVHAPATTAVQASLPQATDDSDPQALLSYFGGDGDPTPDQELL